jgi:non-ribosomal peptide synthetase component F
MNRRVKEQIITGSLAGLLMERAGNSLNSSDADFLVGLPEVRSASPTENWMHVSVTELLARQVKRTRDSLECVDDEPALSYGELDRRSDNLAREQQKQGVKPCCVALAWQRVMSGCQLTIIPRPEIPFESHN